MEHSVLRIVVAVKRLKESSVILQPFAIFGLLSREKAHVVIARYHQKPAHEIKSGICED